MTSYIRCTEIVPTPETVVLNSCDCVTCKDCTIDLLIESRLSKSITCPGCHHPLNNVCPVQGKRIRIAPAEPASKTAVPPTNTIGEANASSSIVSPPLTTKTNDKAPALQTAFPPQNLGFPAQILFLPLAN